MIPRELSFEFLGGLVHGAHDRGKVLGERQAPHGWVESPHLAVDSGRRGEQRGAGIGARTVGVGLMIVVEGHVAESFESRVDGRERGVLLLQMEEGGGAGGVGLCGRGGEDDRPVQVLGK